MKRTLIAALMLVALGAVTIATVAVSRDGLADLGESGNADAVASSSHRFEHVVELQTSARMLEQQAVGRYFTSARNLNKIRLVLAEAFDQLAEIKLEDPSGGGDCPDGWTHRITCDCVPMSAARSLIEPDGGIRQRRDAMLDEWRNSTVADAAPDDHRFEHVVELQTAARMLEQEAVGRYFTRAAHLDRIRVALAEAFDQLAEIKLEDPNGGDDCPDGWTHRINCDCVPMSAAASLAAGDSRIEKAREEALQRWRQE